MSATYDGESTTICRPVSSAIRRMGTYVLTTSLIYIKNNRGARIDPRGLDHWPIRCLLIYDNSLPSITQITKKHCNTLSEKSIAAISWISLRPKNLLLSVCDLVPCVKLCQMPCWYYIWSHLLPCLNQLTCKMFGMCVSFDRLWIFPAQTQTVDGLIHCFQWDNYEHACADNVP